MSELSFSIDLRQTAVRRLRVSLSCPVPESGELELFFATWTPGSYLIREYARHVSHLACEAADGSKIDIAQVAKNRWRVRAPGHEHVRLRYLVHAHELTVRTSHVDADHAYWNGACVYAWPVGAETQPASIRVDLPEGWDLVTQLPEQTRDGTARVHRAADLDAAIDAPFLAGKLDRMPFEVQGVPHEYVFYGLGPIPTAEALIPDTVRIIEEAAQVFGGPLPYDRYAFYSLHTDQGGGGLEHTESSTLLAPRTTFADGKPYRGFMGLVAHEHFHVWNVKRMRPAEFWQFDYEREVPTELLWVAEGFTAYYDDHLCLRAGVHTVDSYLAILAGNINALSGNPGRFALSLSRSSFDAWVRLYRADADTRNTSQNYYTNGSLAALVLDLTIRSESAGERSLDDAMRGLWSTTWEQGRGYTRADVDRCLSDAAGCDMRARVAALVDGPFDPDFQSLLTAFGVTWKAPRDTRPYLGVALGTPAPTIQRVVAGSPADRAGLCPGDELLAVQSLRATADSWEQLWDQLARPGEPVELLLARRGRIESCTVTPGESPATLQLGLEPSPTADVASLRQGWLRA